MRTVDAAGLSIGDDYPPRVMGVLNVSKRSPYEPSVFDDPVEAAAYVDEALVGEGADIVDVGLESANKRFDVLSVEQELDRLDVAVETLERVDGDAVFSIETRYHEVADEALSRGFDMVNDICGFADPEMPGVCEAHDAAVVKMASPPDLERPGAVDDVDWTAGGGQGGTADGVDGGADDDRGDGENDRGYADDVYDALERGGFTEKTIVDPAFGGWSEAKTLADDRETFHRLREFRALGHPILVSINRKNFLRAIADRSTEDALPVSLAATSMAVERGAHVIRTHDVAETRDAALVGDAFARERVRTPEVEELDVTTVGEARRHVDAVGGDPDEAGRGVARAVAVRGLSTGDRRTLASAASDEGALAAGDDALLLAGTIDQLAAVAATVENGAGRLSDVADALVSILQ